MNTRANLLRLQGRAEEALPLAQRALAILEQALGSRHPEVAESLTTLGELARDQGQDEEARLLFERALTIRGQALPATHPQIAVSLAHLGQLQERQSHPEEALPLLERAQAIWEQAVLDHSEVRASQKMLAALLRKLGRDDEAISLEARTHANRPPPPVAL